MSKPKRCGKCRHFLSREYHHRYCLRCKRAINKAIKALTPKPRPQPAPKPEIYLGKKDNCGLCEELDHLYATKRFTKKLCKDCKQWVESFKGERLVFA